MCVVGVRVDKEATGLGREGEREAYRSETDGMLKSQQVAAACPAAGVRRDRRELRPSEEDRGKSRVSAAWLPLVPGQIYSDCHVIVPVCWQCVCQDCVCLVDIVEACWEAVKEV